MTIPVVALVPLRSNGKSRLAPGLDEDERAALSAAMLTDVLLALRNAPVDRVVVAAGGNRAAATARALGVDAVLDPPGDPGLDRALVAAARTLMPMETLVVVAADLPRLAPGDVGQLLEQTAPVAVAATEDGGTGGLLRRPPGVIPTSYGAGSAVAHADRARRAGIRAAVMDLPGFRHDVDTTEDVASLLDGPLGPATTRLLQSSGLAERLRPVG